MFIASVEKVSAKDSTKIVTGTVVWDDGKLRGTVYHLMLLRHILSRKVVLGYEGERWTGAERKSAPAVWCAMKTLFTNVQLVDGTLVDKPKIPKGAQS